MNKQAKTVSRNYRDNVFCIMHREKKYLLSLYNALNGTDYQNEEDITVVTLKDAICISMKNDITMVR